MPFARLTIADPDLPEQTQRQLAERMTRLLADDLDKESEVAVVHINLVPAQRWFVAGRPVPGQTGAHCEVSITAGTNTEQEKATFLHDAYALLQETLAPLPPAAYVALYELDARSYGYNGISQYARAQHNPDQKD